MILPLCCLAASHAAGAEAVTDDSTKALQVCRYPLLQAAAQYAAQFESDGQQGVFCVICYILGCASAMGSTSVAVANI